MRNTIVLILFFFTSLLLAQNTVTVVLGTGSGGGGPETDPVYSGSQAAAITSAGSGIVPTSTERTNWNTAYNNYLNKSLLSARLFVGNASNIATGVVASGDLSLSNIGAFTISNGVVTPTKLDRTYNLQNVLTLGTSANNLPITNINNLQFAPLNKWSIKSLSDTSAFNIQAIKSDGTLTNYYLNRTGIATSPDDLFKFQQFLDTLNNNIRPSINSKLGTTLNSAQIWVGSSGNVATARTITGDVTFTNAGVSAIGASKITTAMIAANAVDSNKILGIGVTDLPTVSTITAGSYTNTNLTIDAKGRVVAASNGSAGSSGDNLGNHTATQAINMNNQTITNATYLSFVGGVYAYGIGSDLDFYNSSNTLLGRISSDGVIDDAKHFTTKEYVDAKPGDNMGTGFLVGKAGQSNTRIDNVTVADPIFRAGIGIGKTEFDSGNSAEFFNQASVYSTSEVAFGTWHTGATIYKKTLVLGNLNSNTQTCTTITSLTWLTSFTANYTIADDQYSTSAQTNSDIIIRRNSSNQVCVSVPVTSGGIGNVVLNIEYLK